MLEIKSNLGKCEILHLQRDGRDDIDRTLERNFLSFVFSQQDANIRLFKIREGEEGREEEGRFLSLYISF